MIQPPLIAMRYVEVIGCFWREGDIADRWAPVHHEDCGDTNEAVELTYPSSMGVL